MDKEELYKELDALRHALVLMELMPAKKAADIIVDRIAEIKSEIAKYEGGDEE